MQFLLLGYSGQGLRSSTRALARAAVLSGLKAQYFYTDPAAKGDRMITSVRVDRAEIIERGPVSEADYVIVFHRSLVPSPRALKPGSCLLLNSTKPIVGKAYKRLKIKVVDGTGIALQIGSLLCAVMLGALVKICPVLTARSVKEGLNAELGQDLSAAVDAGLKAVR